MQSSSTKEILAALAANGRATRQAQDRDEREPDHKPVIKVFNPYGRATWLLTETTHPLCYYCCRKKCSAGHADHRLQRDRRRTRFESCDP